MLRLTLLTLLLGLIPTPTTPSSAANESCDICTFLNFGNGVFHWAPDQVSTPNPNGTCDENQAGTCVEVTGCVADGTIGWVNTTGVGRTVTVTYPNGGKTTHNVPAGGVWTQGMYQPIGCGNYIEITVSGTSEYYYLECVMCVPD